MEPMFERRVIETTPYTTEERLDEKLPVGFEAQDQGGFDGYKLVRYRKYYKDGQEVKQDKWTVNYRQVTEYLRKGTNPDTTIPVPTGFVRRRRSPGRAPVTFQMESRRTSP